MCFIKNISLQESDFKEITKVLEEDLIVYKIVIKVKKKFPFLKKYSYFAPFYDYEYKKKKIYTSPLYISITKGNTDMEVRLNIYNGFHSFLTLKDLIKSGLFIKSYSIARFIIPKGSTIVSNDSEIVSNQIIFIEELK